MKNIKKYLSLAFVLVLSLTLVGCGSAEATTEEKEELVSALKVDYNDMATVALNEDEKAVKIFFIGSMEEEILAMAYEVNPQAFGTWDDFLEIAKETSKKVRKNIGKDYDVYFYYPTWGASFEEDIMVIANNGKITFDALNQY